MLFRSTYFLFLFIMEKNSNPIMTITILVIIKTEFLSIIESIVVIINIEKNNSIIHNTKIPMIKNSKSLFNFLFFMILLASFIMRY